jgi:hypothetical protein
MTSTPTFARQTDRFANDEEGRTDRCLFYAFSARAALQNKGQPFPLLMVRRDSTPKRALDYDATLLLEIARARGLVPAPVRKNAKRVITRFSKDLKTISDDENLINTAAALLERMFRVDAALNLEGGMDPKVILHIVEDNYKVSACVEVGTHLPASIGRSSSTQVDATIVALFQGGATCSDIGRHCGLTQPGVSHAMKRLFPAHNLCFPGLDVVGGFDPLDEGDKVVSTADELVGVEG